MAVNAVSHHSVQGLMVVIRESRGLTFGGLRRSSDPSDRTGNAARAARVAQEIAGSDEFPVCGDVARHDRNSSQQGFDNREG